MEGSWGWGQQGGKNRVLQWRLLDAGSYPKTRGSSRHGLKKVCPTPVLGRNRRPGHTFRCNNQEPATFPSRFRNWGTSTCPNVRTRGRSSDPWTVPRGRFSDPWTVLGMKFVDGFVTIFGPVVGRSRIFSYVGGELLPETGNRDGKVALGLGFNTESG